MLLCRVEGRVWGTRRAPGLEGLTLLELRPARFGPQRLAYDKDREIADLAFGEETLIAADRLGAGVGELVLAANGSRVRDIVIDPYAPVKTVVVAIVDRAAEHEA